MCHRAAGSTGTTECAGRRVSVGCASSARWAKLGTLISGFERGAIGSLCHACAMVSQRSAGGKMQH
eukprot:1688311-Pyramimonas_sp.AAC.1